MTETVTLTGPAGTVDLKISNLRGDTWGPDKILKLERERDTDLLQLLEEVEYEFAVDTGVVRVAQIQPSEVFDLSGSGRNGRVRPRGRTGIIRIDLMDEAGDQYSGEIEVRSRKLDYKTEYRWMLDRIANEASELALSPFAASRLGSLGAEHSQSPETLYQRFEFLLARINSEEFSSAVEQLRYRPHTSFEEEREVVSIHKPLRGGRGLARELSKPGPRTRLGRPAGSLTTLPRTVERVTYEESTDTVPNRLVRYIIENWLVLVDDIEAAVLSGKSSRALPTKERAKQQLGFARAQLEEILRVPAIRDAGRLTQFPASNTVVRSRSGYREFLAAFQATNALAKLSWDQDEDAVSAGQHDVPTLYEYWVFLEIARIVGALRDFQVTKDSLIAASGDGLSLQLRKANEVVVKAKGLHSGVFVELELWFNKSFSHKLAPSKSDESSWTVRMRPDVSLSIAPEGIAPAERTWLHFDAKYKVKQYTEDFRDAEGEEEADKHALPADIQKMHSYRDAIRRSAGAYVVYPGNTRLDRNQYHELLPGLGAFALRPTSSGEADDGSANVLSEFITDAIDHLTSQSTSYQRDRYWRAEVHQAPGYLTPQRSFLEMPPADTPVLLGYLRSPEHKAAVKTLGVYNLRADPEREGTVDFRSEELGAKILVLYGEGSATVYRTSGDVVLRRKHELQVDGYEPGGEMYLCLPFEPEPLLELDPEAIRGLAADLATAAGGPAVASWIDIEPDREEAK